MAPEVVCDCCGGTEFYKEAGFYYCTECQIQSQEIQEHAFQDAEQVNVKTSRKIRSDKTDKTNNKITSWECYNIILLGLTEELINLGATPKLKPTIRILWLRYLEKLQVFRRGKDHPPKLQAVNSGMDAEIIYGKMRKRKKKTSNKSSDELDVTTLDSSSIKQERARKKRKLMQAHYEDFAQKSQGTSSLYNETLTSLQTGSEKSSQKAQRLSYNVYASKELCKKQSLYHFRKHRLDFDYSLKCHKTSYRKISHKYRSSPYILSLNKLYSILYLGLLITKDKIQLSDLLRFIKDGSLKFNCYSKLFPDDFSNKFLNFKDLKKVTVFTSSSLRSTTYELAKLLDVDWYIVCPNLVELCERYCKELNLPKSICDCAKNIISRTKVRMSLKNNVSQIPNYEGRVLSVILFLLKILFGLDDATEFEFGKYANTLNSSQSLDLKTFDIMAWLKYIESRRFLLKLNHFPSSFNSVNEFENIELYHGFLEGKNLPEAKQHTSKDNYNNLLQKLTEHYFIPDITEFPPSLTPCLDYLKLILNGRRQLVTNFPLQLIKDFSEDSLHFVLTPSDYLNTLNTRSDLVLVNGGANENLVIEKIVCPAHECKSILEERRKVISVKLSFRENQCIGNKTFNDLDKDNCNVAMFLENFQLSHKHDIPANEWKRLERYNYGKYCEVNFAKIKEDLKAAPKVYLKHFLPYQRFWMRLRRRIDTFNQKECREYVKQFPFNFQIVFHECITIGQQSKEDFLEEYQQTELYLIYLAGLEKDKFEYKELKNKKIKLLLKNLCDVW